MGRGGSLGVAIAGEVTLDAVVGGCALRIEPVEPGSTACGVEIVSEPGLLFFEPNQTESDSDDDNAADRGDKRQKFYKRAHNH